MKKSLVLFAFLSVCIGAFATGTRNPLSPKMIENQEKTSKLKDGVMMKDGKMFVVKNGEESEMIKAVIMSNGTKVLVNGEVISKNGETTKLENGDSVTMSGKIEKKS